jgi:hypothetical protein
MLLLDNVREGFYLEKQKAPPGFGDPERAFYAIMTPVLLAALAKGQEQVGGRFCILDK